MCLRALLCSAALLLCAERALSCDQSVGDEFIDGYVLYSEVVEHVESTYGSRPTWGIRVSPLVAFRIPEAKTSGLYDVYPMGTGGACQAVPIGQRSEIARDFPIGTTVAVVGTAARATGMPGDIDVFQPIGLLYAVQPGSDLQDLAARRQDYSQAEVPWGDLRFEANKDIARLYDADDAERFATLERLARYPWRLSYLDLLGRFVADPGSGQHLAALRYSEVGAECGLSREQLAVRGWEWTRRWVERCGQRDPYDARGGDDAVLYAAIREDRVAEVKAWLTAGGDPNTVLRGSPMSPTRPLRVALLGRSEDVALALLEAGADFERSGYDIGSVSSDGLARVLDFLLSQDPHRFADGLGPEGRLSLAYTCQLGHYDAVDVLSRHALEQGVDLARGSPDVIRACISSGSFDSARLLVARGIGVLPATARRDLRAELAAIEDPAERLIAAASGGAYEVVQDLLGASAARERTALNRALVAALQGGNPDVARLLLEAGAAPGGGALHAAVAHQSAGIVRTLIARGADPTESVAGATPFDAWLAGKHNAHVLAELAATDARAEACAAAREFPPNSFERWEIEGAAACGP